MIQFEHIEYLFALAVLPLLFVLYFIVIRWKKKAAKKIGDIALVNQLTKNYSGTKFLFKFILFVGAFTVGVVALANPREPMGSANVNRNGIDVMIALDVSKSMLAQDIKPTRLERAKQVIGRLIDKLQNDRIGIVVFAGRAYLQMPLTTDHSAAKMYLSSATPEVVPTQGTVISDALKMCYAAFNTKEKKYRSVILISDGEDHDENAIKTAKALSNEGVMINTIGIGSPEGTTIMDAETGDLKKDAAGNLVITKLNEEELKNLALNGNGIYQLFNNTDDVVSNLDTQLKSLGQRPITESSLVNYKSFFPWLCGLALLLLVCEFFMSEVKRKSRQAGKDKLPAYNNNAKKASVLSMLVLINIPVALFSQSNNGLLKQGNDAYEKKQYDVAGSNYKKVLDKDPANQKAQYNLGNALYKSDKKQEALQAYDAAIQNSASPGERSSTWYNKGVVQQNDKKIPECIESYKNALRLNPADEDARLNLQKALQQQKQEEQKKEKDNKDKKQPKEDPKQKDKQKQDENKDKDEQPKPQPSKMTKQEAEEKLKALLQQEKKLQDKLRRVNAASPNKPEKDW